MFFLLRHLRCTYVIDLERYRVPGPYPYILDRTFKFSDSMMLLSEFEQKLEDQVVYHVYEFSVEAGDSTSVGLYLQPRLATELTMSILYTQSKKRKCNRGK